MDGLKVSVITSARPSSVDPDAYESYRSAKTNDAESKAGLVIVNNLLSDAVMFCEDIVGTFPHQDDVETLYTKFSKGELWKVMNAGEKLTIFNNADSTNYKFLEEMAAPERNDLYWLYEIFMQKYTSYGLEYMPPWMYLTPDIAEPELELWGVDQLDNTLQLYAGTTYFTTAGGQFGSSASPIEQGDLVCILFGSKIPAILRAESDSKYRLVSFAYVSGIMHGEFLHDQSGKPRGSETFVLV
ncbi:hypothetical protein W97_09342 [Coniosporium apollinis CBS 100218]|uniref:Heterokaryon incompatibility domain-containing protein n=1 Tax=Coniosporium apollinis (strain CBS 100218) TaxID=1168221 RepID=R7Z814_CONA1|nr:uncharacterized protein W97_09342 [Coniosporium apollinis CBS 100218]EON70076.1 hypothetical protein W97_09342 [Coniosporium apollinis CBS 100218]